MIVRRQPMQGSISCTYVYLAIVALVVHLAAGRLGVDGHRAGPDLVRLRRSLGREVLQASDAVAPSSVEPSGESGGIFDTISPCEGLTSILTDTPNPDGQLGNFTEPPTAQVFRECSSSSSVYLLNGGSLADSFAQPLPMIKLVTLEPSDPVSWPEETFAPRFTPGSVNMVNCQDQFLDMRAWPVSDPPENATLIFLRCQVLFPDQAHSIVSFQWNVDSSILLPCDGVNPGAMTQSTYTRSNPRTFEKLLAPSDDTVVHVLNMTVWCWTEADILDIFDEDPGDSNAESASFPAWAGWVVGIGAVLALTAVLVTVWMYCGRPCCTCQPRQSSVRSQDLPCNHAHISSTRAHDRSTEELAEALSAVLKTHRFRTQSTTLHNSASTTTGSHAAKYYESYTVRECQDCGHSHRQRRKPSLRAHSEAHVTGSDRASGSAGSRGTESVQCTQCGAPHMGPAVLQHPRSITEVHSSDQEPRRGPAHHPSSVSTRRHAEHRCGALSSELSKKSTEAWVEDSLEARAAMAAADRRGSLGPDRALDVDDVSVGDCYSGTSISLAPPRRVYRGAIDTLDAAAGGLAWASVSAAHHSTSTRGATASASPPSEPHARFYDANETSSPENISGSSTPQWGGSSNSPHAPPRIVQPLRGMHDAQGGARIPWLPPKEGFNSSKGTPPGSPRQALAFDESGNVHPLLKQYTSPPSTHPILQRASPKSSQQSFELSETMGNDLVTEQPLINSANASGPVHSDVLKRS